MQNLNQVGSLQSHTCSLIIDHFLVECRPAPVCIEVTENLNPSVMLSPAVFVEQGAPREESIQDTKLEPQIVVIDEVCV